MVFPDVGNFDIKPDLLNGGSSSISRARTFDQKTDNQKYRTKLVQFFREFERLSNQSQGIVDF